MSNQLLAVGVYLLALVLLGGCASPLPTTLPRPLFTSTPTQVPTATETPGPLRLAPTRIASPANIETPTITLSPSPRPSPTTEVASTITRTPTPWPPPSGRSACDDKRFRSVSLNQDMSFYLYLPPGYFDAQAQRRYPTVYLLSGLGGNYKEWQGYNVCPVMDRLVTSGQIKPMIVVMPSGNDNPAGGLGAYWFNHAPPPTSDGKRWGDYIWKDLVGYIDANYRTIPRRESRAIGGLSAGGQGALTLGLTHPELFTVIGAHSPSFRRADGVIAYFGDQDYYNQYDPEWLVQNTQTWRDLTIWIDVGDHDDQWGQAILAYHNLLSALGVPHEWHLFYGFHDSPYWTTHVPDYLTWYASKLVGQ